MRDGKVHLHLSGNARTILDARYLRRDHQSGEIAETPEAMFRRVARAVAHAESSAGAQAECEELFFEAMASGDLLPNSPCLMNAGTPSGMLSACFVLPVADNMEGIFDSLKLMALIQQAGGGVGFSFARLRPRGARVASTGGSSSGPVSFMRIFDCATENIKQGGKRRGANMGVLTADHPDIVEFVDAKRDGSSFRNFNLSVAASDAFMSAAAASQPWPLRDPRSGSVLGERPAADLLTRIAQAAWETGDPGLLFIDAINRANPTPAAGAIEATNPCGEVPLLPYESCNLASINLSHMVRATETTHEVAWDKLRHTVHLGIRFLDDMLDVNRLPAPQIELATRANRKVGLGVMGFAELLILLGIPYASDQAVVQAEELMRFINDEALVASRELAGQRGVFPNWKQGTCGKEGIRVRNATRTSIAPTGTLSILAGTSAGIEPLFALAYRRRALDDRTLVEFNSLFQRIARQQGFYSVRLEQELLRRGSLAGMEGVPPAAKKLFQCALDIPPDYHLRIQAAFQRHTDNSVSKTINLPHDATVDDVKEIYYKAWQMGLKGITIFRYGSKDQQVLELGTGETPEEREHYARCDPHDCKL